MQVKIGFHSLEEIEIPIRWYKQIPIQIDRSKTLKLKYPLYNLLDGLKYYLSADIPRYR
jgi:hypothetical protein